MGSHATPVTDITLPNGLRVLLREDHAAPLVSFWVFYRVGSRNELPGLTGISHWVEHMQFKGTPTIKKGQIFRDVSRHGGTLNALTSNDWTGYFETLPADQVALSIKIESDRMHNSLFDREETESERTVILSERQGGRNNPGYLLYEEVLGTAFQAHPYRHMVIGYEDDLLAITRDDLFNHYRRYYTPNNAFIVAVGDFSTDALIGEIEAAFGAIPAGPERHDRIAKEPAQQAERRAVIHHPAGTGYLRMAYKAPDAKHPDLPALIVADAILSGAKGMGLHGGAGMGRSSRLHRNITAKGIARSAGSDVGMHRDPHLFTFSASALPGGDLATIERAIEQEIEHLASTPPTEDELRRVIKQVRAQQVYSAEGVTNQAFWLGYLEIVDEWNRIDRLVDEIAAVSADEVSRVVQTWLRPEHRTTGWLIPTTSGPDATGGGGSTFAYWGLGGLGAPAPRPPFEQLTTPEAITVIGQAQQDDPSIALRLRVPAGAINDPAGKDGVALLTSRLLMRGTAHHDRDQLSAIGDDIGAAIGIDAGRLFLDVSIRCLNEDLETMVALAAEVLQEPTFPAEEVEKLRQEILTGIRESDQDTRSTAERAMRGMIYPSPHLLGRRVSGTIDTVTALTREDVVAFHERHFGRTEMVVAAVGGFTALEKIAAVIGRHFGSWRLSAASPESPKPAPVRSGTTQTTANLPGKTQADITMGIPTIPRMHPDYYALDMANLILGRLGLMGRLGATVRDRDGLAYHVSSGLEPGKEQTLWVARAGVAPENVDRAITSILSELRRMRDDGVTDEELADGKSFLTGVLPLALETNDGVANTLLSIQHYDLGLDFLVRYVQTVNELSAAQVRLAIAEHVNPDDVAIAVSGPDDR